MNLDKTNDPVAAQVYLLQFPLHPLIIFHPLVTFSSSRPKKSSPSVDCLQYVSCRCRRTLLPWRKILAPASSQCIIHLHNTATRMYSSGNGISTNSLGNTSPRNLASLALPRYANMDKMCYTLRSSAVILVKELIN